MRACLRLLGALLVGAVGWNAAGVARGDVITWTGHCGTINWAACCVDSVPPPNCTYFNNWSNGPGPCGLGCVPLPGPLDDAIVGVPAIVIESGLAHVRSLMCSGSCALPGTGLQVETTATFGGVVTLDAGNLYGGVMTLSGGLLVTPGGGGLHSITQVYLAANSTWNPDPALANFGVDSGSSLIVNGGVTFDVTGDGSLTGGTTVGRFINNGVFRKTGGTGYTQLGAGVINTGRMEVHSGIVSVSSATLLGGTVDISAGARFEPLAATAIAGLNVTGAGTFNIRNMTVPAGVAVSAANATLSESGMFGPGTLNVSGTLRTHGALNSGTATALAGASLVVEDLTYIGAGASLRNGGVGTLMPGNLTAAGGELQNLAGALMSIGGGVNVTPCCSSTGLSTFNEGTMSTPLAGNSANLVGVFTNSGTLIVQPGTLAVTDLSQTGGTMILQGGTVQLANQHPMLLQGGTVTGSGTLRFGGLDNVSGTVSPGAVSPASAGQITLSVTSPELYRQRAGGTLDIRIGGVAAGTQYGRLTVTGTAIVGGTLRVTLINDFHPTYGQTFTVLASPDLSGQFATVVLPLGMQIHYTAAGVVVSQDACRADFNGSGAVSIQDVFDFLAAWFARLPSADINGSGTVSVQDLFDFLGGWFRGC